MRYDKLMYEALIQESPLFSLDKETEYSAYKRESYKMIEYLYCYLMAVNQKDYEPYGYEIMEVATRCITNFEAGKGVFIHYFNAAWKQEYGHIMGDKLIDDKLRGIKITEEEKRNIRKYIKLTEKSCVDCTRDELYSRIAEAMQLPVEKVRLIAELSSLHVTGDTARNEDGEEISIWEQISDNFSIEDDMADAGSVDELLDTIENTFTSLQERQKKIVSDTLTARIWTMLSNEQAKTYCFISEEIIQICNETGQPPTQRAIAEKYGRDEASISRTVKEFLKKLKISLGEV